MRDKTTLEGRVEALERRVGALARRVDATGEPRPGAPTARPRETLAAPPPEAVAKRLPAPVARPAASAPRATAAAGPRDVWAAPPAARPATPAAPAPAAPRRQPAANERFEEDVLEKWFPRIGALVLLIGLAFGFKYGIDQGWIGPGLRVVAGLATGAILLATSESARAKGWDGYAQGAAGGGVAVTYLSVWSAANMYGLVPAVVGFAGLAATSVLAVAVAVRQDSLPLTIVGVAASFASPLLAGPAALPAELTYPYVIALNLAVVALAAAKDWEVLDGVAFLGSWILYGASVSGGGTSVLFASTIFAIFALLPFIRPALSADSERSRAPMSVINGLTYSAALIGIGGSIPGHLPLVMFVAYACLTAMAAKLLPADRRLVETNALLAFGFATAWPLTAMEPRTGVAYWAVEGLILLAVAAKWRPVAGMHTAGIAVTALSVGVNVLRLSNGYEATSLIFNVESLVLATQLVALSLIAYVTSHDVTAPDRLHPVAVISAHATALAWISLEAHAYLAASAGGIADVTAVHVAWSTLWSLYAAGVLVGGVALKSRLLRIVSVAIFGLTLSKMVTQDLWMLEPLQRVFGFLVLGALLMACSLMFHRFKAFILDGTESTV